MNENEDKIWLASYIAGITQGLAAKIAANLADGAVQVYRERRVQNGDEFDALQSQVDTWRERCASVMTAHADLRDLLVRAQQAINDVLYVTDDVTGEQHDGAITEMLVSRLAQVFGIQGDE